MICNKRLLSFELIFSGLAVVLILYLLIFNMMNVWPHRFHSDAAASIIINNEARHENSLIPQDWYYKDGDLFHYSLLSAPFVEKESFSFESHLSAECFGLIILIICSAYFGKNFFNRASTRLVFIAVILCGFSIQNAEYLLFQQAYILTLSLLLLASSLVYSLLVTTKNDSWNLIKLFVFGLVILALVFINPIRSITTVIPLRAYPKNK
ncbi:MAG: hypothetical protein V9G63_12685 [Candidatus Competibacter sp.]